MADDLTHEEYLRWIPPRAALLAIPGGPGSEINMTAIAHRMQDGILRTVARRATVGGEGGQFVLLTAKFWNGWGFLASHSFWTHGDDELWSRDSTGYAKSLRARVYGVRINPEDLAAEFPDCAFAPLQATPRTAPAIALPAPRSPAKGAKVNRADLGQWVSHFGKANPNATFEIFLTNARMRFSGNWVSERAVKDAIARFGFTKSRGNPSIKRK